MTSPRSRLVQLRGRPAARATGRSLVAAVALTLAASLAACSGGDKADDVDPGEVLAAAQKQLDETSGVRLSLRTSALPDGVDGVLDASGIGTHDPAFEGSIKVLFNGLTADVPVVAVGGKVYAKLPFGGSGFDEINPKDYGAPDPAGLLDRKTGVARWLTAATDVKEGGQSREGKQVLTDYTATIPGKDVAAVIPSADDTATFPTTFRIDDDNRLVSARITGPFYGGKDPVAYTLSLSDYGTDKDITAP